MISKLMTSAGSGALPTYEPGKKALYKYGEDFASRVRDFYEESYWNDLNVWLNKNEPRLDFKFPNPCTTDTADAAKVEAAPAKLKPVPMATPAQVTQNKLRRNSLDPAIDEAIKEAGKVELAAVYLKLKALALDEVMPFTGVLDGDALCYTDDENKPAKLTKNALGKRLKRR
jgi:hypothetical protein